MQRRCSEQTVDRGDRAAHFSEQPAPTVGNGKVNRQHPVREPCRKLMVEPQAQLVAALPVRHRFDSLADLAQRQDAHEKGLARDLIEPGKRSFVGIATDGFGHDIGVKQIAHATSTSRVRVCMRLISRSRPYNGERRMKSTKLPLGFFSRSYSSFDRTTAVGWP